jgi:hypothetical protein
MMAIAPTTMPAMTPAPTPDFDAGAAGVVVVAATTEPDIVVEDEESPPTVKEKAAEGMIKGPPFGLALALAVARTSLRNSTLESMPFWVAQL